MQIPNSNPLVALVEAWAAHFGYCDGSIDMKVHDLSSFTTPECMLTAHAAFWRTKAGRRERDAGRRRAQATGPNAQGDMGRPPRHAPRPPPGWRCACSLLSSQRTLCISALHGDDGSIGVRGCSNRDRRRAPNLRNPRMVRCRSRGGPSGTYRSPRLAHRRHPSAARRLRRDVLTTKRFSASYGRFVVDRPRHARPTVFASTTPTTQETT
jgi:hypothetical protein